MKGKPVHWTESEKKFLQENCKGVPFRALTEMLNKKFGINRSYDNVKGFCTRNGIHNGRDTHFYKGQVSHNKGKKMSPEIYEKASKTFFKKGHRPHNWYPVGTEAVQKDKTGREYIKVKVAEPHVWKLKHRILWEQAYGPIPEGQDITFLDGNTMNLSLDNLRMISKGDNMVLNHLYSGDNMTADERNVVIDITKLNSKIKSRMEEKTNA